MFCYCRMGQQPCATRFVSLAPVVASPDFPRPLSRHAFPFPSLCTSVWLTHTSVGGVAHKSHTVTHGILWRAFCSHALTRRVQPPFWSPERLRNRLSFLMPTSSDVLCNAWRVWRRNGDHRLIVHTHTRWGANHVRALERREWFAAKWNCEQIGRAHV